MTRVGSCEFKNAAVSANTSTWKWCPCSDLMPSKLGFLELSKGHSSSSPLSRTLTLQSQYGNNGCVSKTVDPLATCHCSSIDERLHLLFWIVTVRHPLPKGQRLPFKMLRFSLSPCNIERREHDCNKDDFKIWQENRIHAVLWLMVAMKNLKDPSPQIFLLTAGIRNDCSQCFSLYGSKTITCFASQQFWLVSNVKLAQKQLVKERKVRLSFSKCLNTLFCSLGMRMMVFQLDIDMNISMAGQ